MIKRFYLSVLALCLATTFTASAAFKVGNNTYSVTSQDRQEVMLVKAVADDLGVVSVPSVVENEGTYYTVVQIGKNAFRSSNSKMTIIPATVRKINKWGLMGISGILVLSEDTDKSLERASTLEIHHNQFCSTISEGFVTMFREQDNYGDCAQFQKIFIGRNISLFGDEDEEDDPTYQAEKSLYDIIVHQYNLEELLIGSKVDDFDQFIGMNVEHYVYTDLVQPGDFDYDTHELDVSIIKKVIILNDKTVVKMPQRTFCGTVKSDGSMIENGFTKVYVPVGMRDAYTNETSEWRFFKHIDEYEPYDPGTYDIDADGVINVADISSLFGLLLYDNENIDGALCDINHDGTINAGDVSAMYEAIISGDDRWWVMLDKTEDNFYGEDGFLYHIINTYNKEVKILKFPKDLTDVEVPDQVEHDGITYRVTRIGSYATHNNLTRLVIPASIDSIEHHGLYQNPGLKELIMLGSDDAKPLKVDLGQFKEYYYVSADTSYYGINDWWDCTNVRLVNGPTIAHDHLQLERLYVDRDVIKKWPLLCHQNFLKEVTVGPHVTDLTGVWGGVGPFTVKMDTLYMYAPTPPKETHAYDVPRYETYFSTFYSGTFRFLDNKWDKEPNWQGYYSHFDIQLFVPEEYISNYRKDSFWSQFKNYNIIKE